MSSGPDEWAEAQLKYSIYSCCVIQTVSDASAAGVGSLNITLPNHSIDLSLMTVLIKSNNNSLYLCMTASSN